MARSRAGRGKSWPRHPYQLLFERHPQPILVYDKATLALLAVNEAALRQYGYSHGEFLRMTIKDIRPPEDVPALLQTAEHRAGGLENAGASRHKRKDGSVFFVNVTVHDIEWQGEEARLALITDITESRQVAAALSESEGQIRPILDSTAEGIFGVNLRGACTFCNHACLTLLGFQQTSDLIGKDMHEICHHSLADGIPLSKPSSRIYKAFRQGEGAHASDEVFWRRDGTCFPAEYWSYPIRSDDRLTGYVVSFLDITERKQAEAALVEERRLLRTLIDNMPDYIYVKDAAGRFLVANRAVARLMGAKTPEQLLGKTDFDFYPQDLASVFYRDEQAIIASGQPLVSKEEPSMAAEGITKWTWTTKVPLRDSRDNVVGIVGVGRDITDRRQTERALAESEERFSKAFYSNPEGMTISTLSQQRIVEINNAALRILGYERGEVIGRTLLELHVWPNPDEAPVTLRMDRAGPVREEKASIRTKAGEIRQVQLSAEIIQSQGEACLLAIIRDVTEQEALEQQFRQAQKMEAVGRLAGGVAHDFNNLLNVILGYSDLLDENLAADDPAHRKLAQIHKAGQSAAGLTRQLLAFSRQQVLQLSILDLNAIVTDTEKMLRRLIGEDVEVVTVLGPGLGRVKADAGQIEQVLMNLAVNARDAMPQGGRLTVETANANVDEGYSQQHMPMKSGPHVMLSLTDTGTGMDKKTQKRIFEPFFTTKKLAAGTGLGLSTVYGIVKQSGGFIWAYSELGKGTTFKIYLPRVDAAAEDRKLAAVMPPPQGTETILVVEDAAPLRELTRELLEPCGYTVLDCGDPLEAILVAGQHQGPIQLLLTDVVMPGMSGPALAEKLRGGRPEMRVLLVSGYTDDEIVRHGVEESHVAFLQKPFSRDMLAKKVRETLDVPHQ